MKDKKRLESWKEIADYLDRSARTAQRWHFERGMPVHREAGGTSERVFAWVHEIDAWRQGDKNVSGTTEISSSEAVNEGPDHSHKPGASNKKKRRLKSQRRQSPSPNQNQRNKHVI